MSSVTFYKFVTRGQKVRNLSRIINTIFAIVTVAVIFSAAGSVTKAADYTDSGIEVTAENLANAVNSGDTATEQSILSAQTRSFVWSGSILTRSSGVNYGPNGKETYYNLDMTNCVNNLRSLGYSGDCWARSDGVKMFDGYIIVAADYSVHPLGSIVETSLGTAIVADTGSFAAGDSTLIDVAVEW